MLAEKEELELEVIMNEQNWFTDEELKYVEHNILDLIENQDFLSLSKYLMKVGGF